MTAFLGLGLTHYPPLSGTDERMADLLRWALSDPDVPEAEKDSARWPEAMRREWGDDGGTAAAAVHRRRLIDGLRRCRDALDGFAPDVVIVWGDDQYENFREEAVPPFSVLAYEDTEVEAFELLNSIGIPNVWGAPDDHKFTMRVDSDTARFLADKLLGADFDIAYAYRQHDGVPFPHAIGNTQLFLDYAAIGNGFPYRIVPVTVNCYGRHLISRKGGLARFAEIATARPDPMAPSPKRCFALGAAVARAFLHSGMRVALVASASWSHAFLTDKTWHLRPDTDADRRLYDALVCGEYGDWTATTPDDILASGQHEILNWCCLLGAMNELDMTLSWSTLVTTDIFNSNKCFAIFESTKDALR